jgi:structural maintenance of chromosome 2
MLMNHTISLLQKQQHKEIKRLQTAIEHLTKEAARAAADAKRKQKEDAKLFSDLEKKRRAVSLAQQAVQAAQFNPDARHKLQQAVDSRRAALRKCQARYNEMMSRVGHILKFAFKDPRPGFDRRAVRGVLARLVRVKDARHATALEVAGGGKLSHIVVETASVGVIPPSALVRRGCSWQASARRCKA